MISIAQRRTCLRCRLTGLAAVAAPSSLAPADCRRDATALPRRQARRSSNAPWRPVSVLDEYAQTGSLAGVQLLHHPVLTCLSHRWVAREARPISLRQLMVFGRSLTESRLISSANYVRTELPTR